MEPLNVSATQAAVLLGIQKARVIKLLEAGEIPAFRVGVNWKIPVTLLQKYNEKRALQEARKRRLNADTV